MTGDLDDRYRLYLLTPGDRSPHALTQGPYDVDGAAVAVPAAHAIVYVSSQPAPEERHVWRIPEEGGPAMRVSVKPGQNTPFPSPDGKSMAILHTDDQTPTELLLDGRVLTHPPARLSPSRSRQSTTCRPSPSVTTRPRWKTRVHNPSTP